MTPETNPRVFISYSHDNPEHLEVVLELSNKLRSEGIDCLIDQYEDSPEEGWPKWMDRNITNADYVLIVCTKTYFDRLMDNEKKGAGLGAKWETSLIYQHLYDCGSKNKKFIPIIFNNEDVKYVPIPLKSSTFYKALEQNGYDKLYGRLRGIQSIKPELGKLKPLPEKERKMFIGGFVDTSLWNEAKWNGTAFLFDRSLETPPVICFLFTKKELAEKIIKGWLKRLGDIDECNELRIAIIEGPIPGEGDGYSIHINSNAENMMKRYQEEGLEMDGDILISIGRVNRMNPAPDSQNLKYFKELYKRFGSYFIKVGIHHVNGDLEILESFKLHKREIEFRNISEVKLENDMDALVLKKPE